MHFVHLKLAIAIKNIVSTKKDLLMIVFNLTRPKHIEDTIPIK